MESSENDLRARQLAALALQLYRSGQAEVGQRCIAQGTLPQSLTGMAGCIENPERGHISCSE